MIFFLVSLIFSTILFSYISTDLNDDAKRLYNKDIQGVVFDFRHSDNYYTLLDEYKEKLIQDAFNMFTSVAFCVSHFTEITPEFSKNEIEILERITDDMEREYFLSQRNQGIYKDGLRFTHTCIMDMFELMIGMIDPQNERSYIKSNTSTLMPTTLSYSTTVLITTVPSTTKKPGISTTKPTKPGNTVTESSSSEEEGTTVMHELEYETDVSTDEFVEPECRNSQGCNHESIATGDWRSRFKVMMNKVLRRNQELEMQNY